MQISKKLLWLLVSSLMVFSLVLASCATTTEEEEEEEVVVEEEEEEEEGGPSVTGDWWDKFGEPEYGGTIVVRAGTLGVALDPYELGGGGYLIWYDSLFIDNIWTQDRDIQPYKGGFLSPEDYSGLLAESWEWSDPQTVTVKLRERVYWQDTPPVNGREFVADDVQKHYDRLLGSGSGFTTPNPYFAGNLASLERVIATDKYTVQFKFKAPSVFNIYTVLTASHLAQTGKIEAPEVVQQGPIEDWRNAVSTGPFIVSDLVTNVSFSCSRNPNYWGYDERHPENQLPYVDSVKYISISDMSTAIAALRTGKIDLIGNVATAEGITWQQAKTLAKSNPEIQVATLPTSGQMLEFRCDHSPFTDIKVRKALQMAIDRESIAKVLYGGTVDGTPSGLISAENKGWALPYAEWPQELQEEYSFNPTRAMELLAEAGYPDGFQTNCITFSGGELELLEAIKSMFLDIQVDMEIKTMDFGTWIAYLYSGKQDQMNLMNLTGSLGLPTTTFTRRTTGNRGNWTYNNDPHFDELVSQIEGAATIDEAKKFSVEADQYALQQHWSLNVFPYFSNVVWQPYIKGYSGETLQRTGYLLARMWVGQDLKKSMGR